MRAASARVVRGVSAKWRHCILAVGWALVGGTILGCGGESTGPGNRSLADVNGSWDFTLMRTSTACGLAVASPATLFAKLAFSGDANDVANTVSKWTNDRTAPDRFDLIGNFSGGTGGQVELRFWTRVLGSGFLVTGAFGGSGSSMTFSGTATDPIPGYQPYLSTSPCQYSVSGRKTG